MKYKFKIICALLMVLSVCFTSCVCTVSANEFIIPETDEYTEVFYKYYCGDREVSDLRYKTLYVHYGDQSSDTPEYVLSFMSQTGLIPHLYLKIYDDYVLYNGGWLPYWLGLYVYTPADGNIYKFDEAYQKIDDMDACFMSLMENKFAYLIGDVNSDYVLNIKDATFMQKCFVKQESFYVDHSLGGFWQDDSQQLSHIADYNRDGKCDIRDATAVQKYVANIE